jgi:phosphate transport system substrate-binding protein
VTKHSRARRWGFLWAVLFALVALAVLTACHVPEVSPDERSEESNPVANSVPQPPQLSVTEPVEYLTIDPQDYPVIDGSTSTLGIVRAIYREVFGEGETPGVPYPQQASKTVPSYRRLISGEADLIIVPYASPDVLREAAEAGVTFQFYKVAAEALIFITPAGNTATGITGEEVRKIYLDNGIKNWSEMGGPDRKLIPICRNADSGSQSQMDNLILAGKPMHPSIQKNYVELTMEGMLEQVAFYHSGGLSGRPTDSYALGYTLFLYLKNVDSVTGIGEHLKILTYDGVEATVESIADGSYPLSDGYYAVVRSDLPGEHSARTVIAWLQSDRGAAAIESAGMLPAH